jgi:hypothetical protein
MSASTMTTDSEARAADVAGQSVPIAEYGLLSNCNTAALVSRAGSVDSHWLEAGVSAPDPMEVERWIEAQTLQATGLGDSAAGNTTAQAVGFARRPSPLEVGS